MDASRPRRRARPLCARLLLLATCLPAATAAAQVARTPYDERPAATIDLETDAGVALVRGQWRCADAAIVAVDHREPGPDLRASGPPNRTHDVVPHAGGRDFDDSGWQRIAAAELRTRRGHGRLSFAWYRTQLTIPERIGTFDPTGSTVVFEVVVDDYAEVWVDGELPLRLGQSGGALVRGFNAPNRLVIARDVRPGQTIQLAVFGANGPLSAPPANFVWVRSAVLDFCRPAAPEPVGSIERLDPAMDGIFAADAAIERVASGFEFTEGPVWMPQGYLLFSDPNANKMYRWTPDGELGVFQPHSGYAGADIAEFGQPGSNGLAVDPQGRLTICQHGNRRVVRMEGTGAVTVLADRDDGRRLNSPNDLIYRRDGTLFFTDPPFGLPAFHDDRRRELPYCGVYCVRDGVLRLLDSSLRGPNGIAFSPDERILYVGDWDEQHKVVMRYRVAEDGSLSDGSVFFDAKGLPGNEAIDGVEVDRAGNLFVSGPGGVTVLSQDAHVLGRLHPPELAANFAFGDADGRTLYMTARTGLYRVRTRTGGLPAAPPQKL
ncbi:MAG: SMP-30/gluconolactonase/LRE family protein [Planctomycetota bacterium]